MEPSGANWVLQGPFQFSHSGEATEDATGNKLKMGRGAVDTLRQQDLFHGQQMQPGAGRLLDPSLAGGRATEVFLTYSRQVLCLPVQLLYIWLHKNGPIRAPLVLPSRGRFRQSEVVAG